MTLISIRPTTGEPFQEHAPMADDVLQAHLSRSVDAFADWRRTDAGMRADLLRGAAAQLDRRRETLAELITQEMGKVVSEARAEIEKCAWVCRYYAQHAGTHLRDEPVETDFIESYLSFHPLGTVLAVMPWNFPFWQVFRFAAPTLAAGNVALLKHAGNVQLCAQAIESIFQDAGFPAETFVNLAIEAETVRSVIEHPAVAAVSLTGSSAAGRAVAAAAGQALKKTVLELGGSDPYLILDDADVELAAEVCVTSRMLNAGQSCIAAKRFIVTERRSKKFEAAVVRRMAAKVVGNPMDPGVDLGPLARVDLRDELHRQIRQSLDAGARLALGGEIPDGPGAWYPPTVLADVGPGMPAHDEELFGPCAAILTVGKEDDAIDAANASAFGLGAAIFTADRRRGERIARDRLDVGAVFVNDFVRSDPRLPFGGIKNSGYGRELGRLGIREFVNAKTVVVAADS